MRLLVIATLLGLGATMVAPAAAQTYDTAGPHSAYCGSWQNGAFVPNGNCREETTTTTTTTTVETQPAPNGRMPGMVRGTITSVSGHLVTLQQSSQSIVLNDRPALTRQDSGRVAVGRQVVAHGYWEDGTFYATRMDTTY